MLGCIQPISSPMMKSIFGFCCCGVCCCGCCAATGTLAIIAETIIAIAPTHVCFVVVIDFSLLVAAKIGRQPTPSLKNCDDYSGAVAETDDLRQVVCCGNGNRVET
jgi:hypothetical protein